MGGTSNQIHRSTQIRRSDLIDSSVDLFLVGQNLQFDRFLLARNSIVSELGFIVSFVWVRAIFSKLIL